MQRVAIFRGLRNMVVSLFNPPKITTVTMNPADEEFVRNLVEQRGFVPVEQTVTPTSSQIVYERD